MKAWTASVRRYPHFDPSFPKLKQRPSRPIRIVSSCTLSILSSGTMKAGPPMPRKVNPASARIGQFGSQPDSIAVSFRTIATFFQPLMKLSCRQRDWRSRSSPIVVFRKLAEEADRAILISLYQL